MGAVEPPSRVYDVVVVGGGASGTLLAVQLLRQARSGIRVALVDRGGLFARGVAFSTQDPTLLLDAPAERMSALPDDPDHFARWLARVDAGGGRETFAPRRRYGRYLEATLDEARRLGRRVGGRVDLVEADVIAIEAGRRGIGVTLLGNARISAPTVVLALGLAAPADPPLADARALAAPLYQRWPWSRDALAGLPVEAEVLLLGTGLTMVELALTLAASGHRGRIHALSRHGLLPRAHAPSAAAPLAFDLGADAAGRVRTLVRWVREAAGTPAADGGAPDWRPAVDAVRSQAHSIWRGLPDAERRRFLRHVRSAWDAHRHRTPPEVATDVGELERAGQLRVEAGRLVSLSREGGAAEARWRRRGGGAGSARVLRVVNCTGPALAHDPLATPVVASLLSSRLARPGPLGIGLDTDGVGALVDASGRPSEHLFAIGPMRRAELWETTDVAEIAGEAVALAKHLLT